MACQSTRASTRTKLTAILHVKMAEMLSKLDENQRFFMDKAFDFAREALINNEVPVGCIFVYNNDIISSGRNTVNETKNATRHAELNCVDQVMEYCKEKVFSPDLVFREVDVFVTVEPCIMCAAALYSLNIKRVIFGCRNDRFGGQTVLDVASVTPVSTEVSGGYRADDAMALLKEFYKGVNPCAPSQKAKTKGKT